MGPHPAWAPSQGGMPGEPSVPGFLSYGDHTTDGAFGGASEVTNLEKKITELRAPTSGGGGNPGSHESAASTPRQKWERTGQSGNRTPCSLPESRPGTKARLDGREDLNYQY